MVTESREVGNLATAEMVFPFRSSLVVAGIPEMYLPLCGPKTLSCYHCQVLPCILDFTQKATAFNHVHHDHLNAAPGFIYCSFKSNPKMHWYSASAWNIILWSIWKIICLFFQIILLFLSNSCLPLVIMLFPVPQDKVYPMKKRSESGQRLPNISLRKNKTPVKSQLQLLSPLKWEGPKIKFPRITGSQMLH